MQPVEMRKPAALDTRTGSEVSTSFPASDNSNTIKPAKRRQAKDTAQQRWNAEHPIELWAHGAVASAIRRGIIVREPCSVCGNEPTDFHHTGSYLHPLEGQFLCRLHHRREHKRMRCEATG